MSREELNGKKRGRPRMMLLNWMMKDDYTKFKERAGQSGE